MEITMTYSQVTDCCGTITIIQSKILRIQSVSALGFGDNNDIARSLIMMLQTLLNPKRYSYNRSLLYISHYTMPYVGMLLLDELLSSGFSSSFTSDKRLQVYLSGFSTLSGRVPSSLPQSSLSIRGLL